MTNARRGIRRPSAPATVTDQLVAEPPVERPVEPSAKPSAKRPAEPPRVPAFNPAVESERHLRTIANILVFWNVLIILGLLVWVLAMFLMANAVV